MPLPSISAVGRLHEGAESSLKLTNICWAIFFVKLIYIFFHDFFFMFYDNLTKYNGLIWCTQYNFFLFFNNIYFT